MRCPRQTQPSSFTTNTPIPTRGRGGGGGGAASPAGGMGANLSARSCPLATAIVFWPCSAVAGSKERSGGGKGKRAGRACAIWACRRVVGGPFYFMFDLLMFQQ